MKKKIGVLVSILLTATMIIPSAAAKTFSGQCGPELYWQKTGRTITITGQGEMWNYGVMDDCVAKETPFRQHAGTVNAAVLPEGLTSIGKSAFVYQRVLYNFTIPSTVTKIGDSAFRDCCRYEGDCELTLPAGLTYIGNSAFSGCERLVSERFVLPEGLTNLGDYAFDQCCGLKADGLVIPDGITKIGYAAFRNCSGLEGNLHIPAGVKRIEGFAFTGTKFTSVYFYGDAPEGYLPNGNYSVGLPEGAVLYYPLDAAGWTDSEYYDAQTNTWNGYELRAWNPGKVTMDVQQELENGSAVVSVKNFTPREVNGYLWCAAYTKEGKMLAAGNREISLEMAVEEEFRIPLNCRGQVGCVKVFLLDESQKPIV